jgi:DNA-binding response OmpR family regulator
MLFLAMIYRVIVADSSPSVRRAVEMAFPESDFEVFFFGDGLELVKALPDIRPDALLISVSLPGLDGYRAAGVLRGDKDLRQASLFFLRGAFERFEADKAAGLDYEDVVRKPFDSEALAGRVKGCLDRKNDLLAFPQGPFPEEEGPGPVSAERPLAPHPASSPSTSGSADLAALVRQEVSRALAETEDRLRTKLLKEMKAERKEGRQAGRSRKPGTI